VLVVSGGLLALVVYGVFFSKGKGTSRTRRGFATETSYGVGDLTYTERQENW
jgi:hypothetical protein